MTPLNKGIILVSTLGALGGTGAYAGGLFNSNTQITDNPEIDIGSKIVQTSISDKLKAEGFDVLDVENTSQDWTTVLEDYKQATTKTFSGKAENNKKDKDLRDKCRDVLALKDDSDYAKAKMWCVKKEKMNEVLKRGGYKVLGADSNLVSGEEKHWNDKINKWRTAVTKPFSELTSKIKDTPSDASANIELFRAECKKLKITELHTTKEEFEANFELAREWCSVKEG